ncbi:Zn(2)-C6 fungal-type DNA-binding domain protein [Akanthomyces lecanii RCEF 1005]|uniref:Zn(2)-C6 fungal-type DNA-binding domain protein n=1 Tax=Akanthomyces lecanii RCEF 1005 TaxID=1081108 RepID=A0A162KD97_CORDF|nr:Zn(2)-C6 fungal-type DNA-binding domain protein [Akanthomyces lecanii RCEF 1005]
MFSKTHLRPSRCPRCKLCRQKKIKCDYAQPRCGPCVKANLTCEPYKQQFHFIHAESQPAQDTEAVARGDHHATPGGGKRPPRHSAAAGDTPELDWHVATAPPPPASLSAAQALRTSPMLMTGSLARDSVFDQFLRYYLPDGSRLHANHSSRSWLATARGDRQGFPSLEAAACALGVLTLGRGTKDLAMQRRSLSLYGDALGFARRWIAAQMTPDDGNLLRVLETINLLSLFEALAPPDKQQRTLIHVAGPSALISLAGPSAFQEPEAHNILLHARSAINIPRRPRWVSEPWAYIPQNNVSICLDAIALVPTLLELANTITDSVESGGYHGAHLLPPLLQEFDAVSAQLRSMLQEMSALFVRTPYGKGSGNVHEFAAVQLHHCCELFRHDAVRRVACCHVSHHLMPATFSCYAEEVSHSRLEMEISARAIIADIDDFNTDGCGFLTANMLFLPTLAAANQFLKRNNSEDKKSWQPVDRRPILSSTEVFSFSRISHKSRCTSISRFTIYFTDIKPSAVKIIRQTAKHPNY